MGELPITKKKDITNRDSQSINRGWIEIPIKLNLANWLAKLAQDPRKIFDIFKGPLRIDLQNDTLITRNKSNALNHPLK